MHLSEAQSALLQKQMARMLTLVQVVGIVYDALYVTLIVAHLHPRFINVLFLHNRLQRYEKEMKRER